VKIRDFIQKFNEETKTTVCMVCKKDVDQFSDDTVSDISGNLYHEKCFNKAFGNEELKKRRTDEQLPF
jgi:hypothetical protein